ncbi:hypothetical protein F5Y04DRAFT_185297 [Hypomontagnella monticulosa]|nr:hypothetical protein F5Y04DRAFT_185297 [Hypomontagnella monticulosa]
MEPGPRLADAVLFPTAAYFPELQQPVVQPSNIKWEHSSLNPANRIDSLDAVASPTWDIDGVSMDGQQIWAIPRFARGKPPKRIDIYYQASDLSLPRLDMLEAHKLFLVGGAGRGSLDVTRHFLRALEYWSSKVPDFERQYMNAPFGSQIAIKGISHDVASISIRLILDYNLERQWLSSRELQNGWGVEDGVIPEEINIDKLQFKRQLQDSICVVAIDGQPELGDLIFKSHPLNVQHTYRELRNLIRLPPHPNVQQKPLYLVSKRVRFGGKRGICGYLMEFLPMGSLDMVLGRFRDQLLLSTRIKWAKDITRGLIAIRDSPLGYYPDLKPDNVIMVNPHGTESVEDLTAVIIDFEQSMPWMKWAPPEVYWINHIERIASGNVDDSIKDEAVSLLLSLVPDWKPTDRNVKYRPESDWHCPAWAHLNATEKTSGVVYMLGKTIWSIMEGAVDIIEPATLSSFWAERPAPIFPTFHRTPPSLQECLRQCTSGAPEWNGRKQPFHIQGGKIKLREMEGLVDPFDAQHIQSAAREWWKEELAYARRYIRIRTNGPVDSADENFVSFMYKRPGLEDVLLALEKAEQDC